ncbi:hypothetical protein [Croceivirga thetidis]|uniref:Carboxypeptidase-like regulatory domain-containing protein n=1 Tax=Croceivirga thetidis TaxID=2721623 RepID=A0ABX1GKD6_9FLAO|nr:hypothetical protein [Croceivirga thetidis]NKI30324.1 hypothetical protein [Croceivirga thetidis]
MRFFGAIFIVFFCSSVINAQDGRSLLRGQVIYRGVNVPNEYVINTTTETSTITNEDGQFAIEVKIGDELVFTAVNYQYELVKITAEILQKNRLVVEVEEKVRELDEVTVSPEDQEKFVELKNEEFKEVEYEIDRGAEIENVAMSRTERGMRDGINFVNIFKALFKGQKNSEEDGIDLRVSDVLRTVYDDEFFLVDLRLPRDKIDAFLIYVDEKVPSKTLLRKENEFELLDFLVTESDNFRAELEEN